MVPSWARGSTKPRGLRRQGLLPGCAPPAWARSPPPRPPLAQSNPCPSPHTMLGSVPCKQCWPRGPFNTRRRPDVPAPWRQAPQDAIRDPGRQTSRRSPVTVRGECGPGQKRKRLFCVIKFQNVPCHVQLHTYRERCVSDTATSGGRKAMWSVTGGIM